MSTRGITPWSATVWESSEASGGLQVVGVAGNLTKNTGGRYSPLTMMRLERFFVTTLLLCSITYMNGLPFIYTHGTLHCSVVVPVVMMYSSFCHCYYPQFFTLFCCLTNLSSVLHFVVSLCFTRTRMLPPPPGWPPCPYTSPTQRRPSSSRCCAIPQAGRSCSTRQTRASTSRHSPCLRAAPQ